MGFKKFRSVPEEYQNCAVLYCRYSSDKQTENSIDGQLRADRAYCEAHDLEIVGEYIDRAVSGTTDDRPEFQRMIEDAKKRRFAFVVVYRFDRFSRNRYDSAMYKQQLQSCGVRVLSTEESVGNGDEGIILEAIYEAMAETYSRNLSRIVTRGMRERAMHGESTGGNIPIGFKVEDKQVVIDERTAPAVRLAFDRYMNARTKKQIADELNALGYRSKNGLPFDVNSVTRILKNPMYKGSHNFEDIERTCPAIVTPEAFDAVQTLLEVNRHHYGRKVSDTFYALSGKLFCGKCGASMIGDSGTGKNGDTYYYYTCQHKKKSRSCTKKSEKKDFIEWYVCEQTVENVLTDENIPLIAAKVAEVSNRDLKQAADRADEIRNELAQTGRELDELTEKYLRTKSASMMELLDQRAQELDERNRVLTAELEQLDFQAKLRVTPEEIEAYLTQFKKGNLFDEDFRRRLINTLVNCVYLFDDKIVIYFNLRVGREVSYFDMLNDLETLPEVTIVSDSSSDGSPKEQTGCLHPVCSFDYSLWEPMQAARYASHLCFFGAACPRAERGYSRWGHQKQRTDA